MVREDNQAAGKTWTWQYDNAGNIINRKEYAYTTASGVTADERYYYTYGDTNWGDLLQSYDGRSYTYDGIGNPLSDGKRSYTWRNGRELATLTQAGNTWSMTYNADGLRTKRVSSTTTYTYYYSGSNLRQMYVGSTGLYFRYDPNGTPVSVTYGGTIYYYITNLQGDVTALVNASGATVVSYIYDAWGNILATSGSLKDTLGKHNPLRYRGYVYDEETGLYYLQSRYYDPEIGRFINADTYAATGQGLLSKNVFGYCLNNPVIHADFGGKWTIAVGAGGNANCGAGVSGSWQITIDSKGNIAYQTTYAVPGVNDTFSTGLLDFSVGVFFQYTNADSYNDLNKYAVTTGFSAGGGVSAGVEAVELTSWDKSLNNMRDDVATYPDGFQLSLGAGYGVDVHTVHSYTDTVWSYNIFEIGETAWDFIVSLFE